MTKVDSLRKTNKIDKSHSRCHKYIILDMERDITTDSRDADLLCYFVTTVWEE